MCFCERVCKTENITLFEGFHKEMPFDDFLNLSQGICEVYPLLASIPHLKKNTLMPLRLITIQLWHYFALSFQKYYMLQLKMQPFTYLFFFQVMRTFVESTDIVQLEMNKIFTGLFLWVFFFFSVFCKATEKEFCTLAPRASSCKCLPYTLLLPVSDCS